jgi:hypothetical protein
MVSNEFSRAVPRRAQIKTDRKFEIGDWKTCRVSPGGKRKIVASGRWLVVSGYILRPWFWNRNYLGGWESSAGESPTDAGGTPALPKKLNGYHDFITRGRKLDGAAPSETSYRPAGSPGQRWRPCQRLRCGRLTGRPFLWRRWPPLCKPKPCRPWHPCPTVRRWESRQRSSHPGLAAQTGKLLRCQ